MKLKKPWLENAEQLAQEQPEKFNIVIRRNSLRAGDAVKLECGVEAIWVRIYRTAKRAYRAKTTSFGKVSYFGRVETLTKLVDNHGLSQGDRVKFGSAQVFRAMRLGHLLP